MNHAGNSRLTSWVYRRAGNRDDEPKARCPDSIRLVASSNLAMMSRVTGRKLTASSCELTKSRESHKRAGSEGRVVPRLSRQQQR